jgi:ribose transport system permease protein
MSPHFLTVSNILNVLRQISTIAVIAIGMTYVIITGGIDLSVGSVLALSAVVSAYLMTHGTNMYFSIIVGLIVGALCGFLNGIFIATRINMPPFITTLAMMGIARGFGMVITDGRPIYGLPEQFGFIAGGYVLGIPVPVIITILLYIIGYVHLSFVRTGVYYYAVGGNQEASRVAGVNIKRVKISAYIISGLTASIGGIILSSRLVSVEPLSGLGYELDAIAAAVIGGANLYGGEGNLIGTIIGAIITGVLRNGLNLLNVSAYWQQVSVGIVIAVVVLIKTLRKK